MVLQIRCGRLWSFSIGFPRTTIIIIIFFHVNILILAAHGDPDTIVMPKRPRRINNIQYKTIVEMFFLTG